jgi:hypothetical protein
MEMLDDIEAVCVIFALYKEYEISEKQKRNKLKDDLG